MRAWNSPGLRALLCVTAVLVGVSLVACGRPAPTRVRVPTPTVVIRHRDALSLMPVSEDLGPSYRAVEERRLERGKGWGDDTTRLSGYRTVFEGPGEAFSRIVSQVECYLSVEDAQAAYRAYRESLSSDLRGNASNESVTEGEERLLGDWNRMFSVRSPNGLTVHYVFIRENVFVELALTGQDVPDLPDQAARQARLLDERVYKR